MPHEIQRVRHELRRRTLSVKRIETVTPGMRRLVLSGEELAGFTSLSPDDHVKLFVRGKGQGEGEGQGGDAGRRDYTPRRYDAKTGELAIDFALHDAGAATLWAKDAVPGDRIEIGGPRGSVVVPPDFDWWLLVGDETALPAIGRRLEELPSGTKVQAVIVVTGPEEEQNFDTATDLRAVWVHRPAERADDPEPVLDVLRSLAWPSGDGFAWIAAEANVARAVRSFITEERAHPTAALRASGYWKKGVADTHETLEG